MGFGRGVWTASVTGRGGSPVRMEVPYSSLQTAFVLNNSGSANLSVPNDGTSRSACCELFAEVEPWQDEIVLYRDGQLAYVGPLVTMIGRIDGGDLRSNDLFHWFENRFLESDFHGDGDVADIFASIASLALEPENSMNMTVTTRPVGIQGTRDFKGLEFHRAADLLRELSRTGLDFTMDGRRLLGGGAEIFENAAPLILHDDGVLDAEVTIDGTAFATDVAVFGGTSVNDFSAPGDERLVFATGRATTGTERYGLVQRSFTELYIKDGGSADANASARLDSMQPAPVRVRATLGPEAAFEWNDLLPGRRMDVRLKQAAGCIEVMEVMRVLNVNVSVNVSDESQTEQVSIDLVPSGTTDVPATEEVS